ncbi:MAG: hypothetical protein ACTHN7_09620 [Solirubrobacterales bacterium]
MRTRDKAIALALALCAAVALGAALSAPAGAAGSSNGFEVARFKVEIKGYQNMVQHHTHEASGECDVSDYSFGREHVSFHTTKPIYITATHMPGEFNPQIFGGPQLGIPTVAKVQRSFTPVIGRPTGACGENGGADPGAEEVKPDCGAKQIKPWRLELQYAREKKNALLLSGNGDQDPYTDCPGASTMGFPWLLVEKSGYKGKYISAELSQDELFHPQFRKWISIADGSAKNVGSDYWTKTDVHWEVSFTRLKSKAPGV